MYKSIRIPEKYEEDIKKFILKKEFDDFIERARQAALERMCYARKCMLMDSKYREELKQLEKPYLEKYSRQYMQLKKDGAI